MTITVPHLTKRPANRNTMKPTTNKRVPNQNNLLSICYTCPYLPTVKGEMSSRFIGNS
jgi:hypothetical protein